MKNQNTCQIGSAFTRGLGLILMLTVSSARADFTLSSTGQSFAGDRLQDALLAAAVEDTITVSGVNTGMPTVGANWNEAKPRVSVQDKKITFVGTGNPNKIDGTSFTSVINNYWIEIGGSDASRASYTFRNLKFTGDSAVIAVNFSHQGEEETLDGTICLGTLAFDTCYVDVTTSVGNGKSIGSGYYSAQYGGTPDRYWYNAFLCCITSNMGVTKYLKVTDSFLSSESNLTTGINSRTISGGWNVVKAEVVNCIFGKSSAACRDNLAIVFDGIGDERKNALDSTTPIEITIRNNVFYMYGDYQVMLYLQYANILANVHHVTIDIEDNVVDSSGWPQPPSSQAFGKPDFDTDKWLRVANISGSADLGTNYSKFWTLRSRRNTVNGHCANIFGNAKNLVKEGYNNVLDEQHGHWWEHVKDVPSYGTKTNANLYRETIGGVTMNCAQRGEAAYRAGIFHFGETKYCELCDTVTGPRLTSLWITDHADAGAGKVHLAFQPVFDMPLDMNDWIPYARENSLVHYVTADTEAELASAPLKDDFTFRNGSGNLDAQKGWCWITVPSTKKLCKVVIYAAPKSEGVQLWEDGPIWAECNVGATKPEEFGYYFWWGDTIGYTHDGKKWVSADGGGTEILFSTGDLTANQTYKLSNKELRANGWTGADNNLLAKVDAASAHLGGTWRTPTFTEIKDLVERCNWTWTTRNGVNGHLVTGKGAFVLKSIFIPAAAYGYRKTIQGSNEGHYWSSSPLTIETSGSQNSAAMFFISNKVEWDNKSRFYGLPVRPIRDAEK